MYEKIDEEARAGTAFVRFETLLRVAHSVVKPERKTWDKINCSISVNSKKNFNVFTASLNIIEADILTKDRVK